MRKRLLLMMLLLLPVVVSRAATEINGIYYNLDTRNKTVEVTSGTNKYTGSVTIPASVSYNGVRYSVTSIASAAFRDCSGLTSITTPSCVTSIGDQAFLSCSGLTSITIPDGVTSIGNAAFYGCSGLTSITIPDGVTSIGNNAFYGCSGLTSITIPSSVTSIGNSAFGNCGLNSVHIDPDNKQYDSRDNCNAIIEKATNTLIIGSNNSVIPASVTSIGNSAFSGCSGLSSITIPSSVTTIGDYAFYNCSGLTSITIPSSLTSIGRYALNGTAWYNKQPNGLVYAGMVAYNYKGTMPSNTSIVIKDGTLGIAKWAFSSCSGLTSITIPASVTTIEDGAFASCSGLTSIAIQSNVTSIGYSAFSGCSGLTSITIPSSVTSLGVSAFSGCSSLISITIPSSVTSIGGNAFYGTAWYNNQPDGLVYAGKVAYKYKGTMPSNTSVALNEGTLGIADGAFSGCSGLSSITIPSSVTSIGESAFFFCSGLASVTIPSSVTSIGYQAFSSCSGLTSVSIPDGVKSIGNSAFSGCSGLTSITIPSSVTSIGNGAFSGCSCLTSITIPDGVTSIENGAFNGCSGLTSIMIPSSVTSIGDVAFDYCSGLTSIAIPSSVTSIGRFAFGGCSSLTDYYCYAEDVPQTGHYAFSNSNISNATLHVPAGSVAAYQSSALWSGFKEIVPIDDEEDDLQRYLDSLIDSEDELTDNVYRREFKNGEWQSLYIPFEMDYSDWSNKFDVASINGLRKLDGHIVIEATIIENGTLQANYPYLIRAKSDYGAMLTVNVTGSVTKTTNSVTFYGLNYSEGMTLPIIGNYSKRTGLKSSYERRMQGGTLSIPGSDSEVLMPYRWYVVPGQMTSRELRLRVNGEKVMAIDNASVSKEDEEPLVYDLQGRKVDGGKPLKGGLYIINNKKYVVK